ncbi:MAG: SDR family oxidoreductase [Dehalococcoidia bacterium]
MGRLDGKVALVVGASPNNGGTTAHFMAREGAQIAANDLIPEACEETVEFIRSQGYDAIGLAGDASDVDSVQEVVNQTVEHFGKIDILVNMAGKQYRWPVWDVNIHDWERQLKGYLTGGMLTTKYVSRVMMEKGTKGSIIHILSDAAHQGEAGNSGYSAAKGGLLNFTRAAAMDLAHLGIRVNTISPTYVEHNMWRFGGVATLRTRHRFTPDDLLKGVPLGRFCRASDIGNAAIFLASEESSFMTGSDIPLDGGARARYWPWIPGNFSGIDAQEYFDNATQMKYGVPIDQLEQ